MRRLAAFRVDAAVWMGIGHLSRCLSLARELRENGWETIFLTSSTTSAWIDRIVSAGNEVDVLDFPVASDPARGSYNLKEWNWAEDAAACKRFLRTKATWLIIDHYALDASWECEMKEAADHVMVIDDLANRRHDCDVLLDQNLRNEDSYRDLLPDGAKALLGPMYALLRPEFGKFRRKRALRSIERLNVFMGGTDPLRSLLFVLDELSSLEICPPHIDVIAGSESPALPEARELIAHLPGAKLHVDTERVAELFSAADLAIGAGGIAALERCAVGLPTVSISVAENQDVGLTRLHDQGAIEYLGRFDRLQKNELAGCLQDLFRNVDRLNEMSERAMVLVDGFGSRRVRQLLS